MTSPYTKEQLKKIYKTLPEELKEALGSFGVQDEIYEICQRNSIENETRIQAVYDLSADVLMGLVNPSDFGKELQDILGRKKDAISKIAHEITRFVFFPVKAELAQIHRLGEEKAQPEQQARTPQPQTQPAEEPPSEEATLPELAEEKKPRKSKGEDPYRETLE